MTSFFRPNIDRRGRLWRGFIALSFFVGAALTFPRAAWLSAFLAACGAFVLFEALRGWCALRACGIKTKI
jgi:hypothetical protein